MRSVSVLQGVAGRTSVQVAALIGVLLVLVVVRQMRVRGRWSAADILARATLLVAVAVVLVLTLRPFARPGAVEPMLMLDPVAGAWGWDRIAWGPVVDNVALFVPLGILGVAAFWHRSAFTIWFGCVVLSGVIEATQFLIPTGRVANTADVLANAVGALIGVLIGLIVRGRSRPRRPERPRVGAGAG